MYPFKQKGVHYRTTLPVPERNDFMSVGSHRKAKSPEISRKNLNTIQFLLNKEEYYKYLARPKSANLIDPLLSIRRF